MRALRHRRGWRQRDLAGRTGVSQRQVARIEAGELEQLSFRAIRRISQAVGLDVSILGRWRGGDLDRLLDADHAALQASVKSLLERAGWIAAAEVTFNERGERGSIDLLAFHSATGALVVVEIKTVIADVQGLLRPLDIKVRLAAVIARRIGWNARIVVPCLVVAEGTTTRRRLDDHAPLFARFVRRGHEARRWLRAPGSEVARPMLLLQKLPPSRGTSVRRAGRQRVRVSGAAASVGSGSEPGKSRPIRA